MHLSPYTSFSNDGTSSVIAFRYIPFPSSDALQPKRPLNSSQCIDFNKELHGITSTQHTIHSQLGNILMRLDSLSPPTSSVNTAPENNTSFPPPTQQPGGWN